MNVSATPHSHSYRSIFVVALIILCTVTIDVSMQFFVENQAREHARLNLKQIRHCMDEIVTGEHVNNDVLEQSLKICAGESKTTLTGDVFAYDLNTKEFVFDPSLDCYVPGGKSMTIDSECGLHKDPKRCEVALSIMDRGYDSDRYTKNWWMFDDAKEYLEYVILPWQDKGFKGDVRGSNTSRPHQLLVAQGVQEDELMAQHKPFRYIIYFLAFFSIIINLLLAKVDRMKDEQRCARTAN